MYGVAMGGYYSLVWKAISVPSVLVTVAIADTFHSRLASLVRDEPERVAALFRTTSAGLLLAGSVPAFVLGVWGEPIFGWAFGALWRVSGEIAALVAPWYLAQFIVSPLSRVVVVLSGQETKLIWDVACLGSLLGVFLWAHSHATPALVTIRLLSIVYTLLFVAYYLLLVHIIFRFEKSRASSQATDR
jgi:O-antigen/teichoic acid export membrane protein